MGHFNVMSKPSMKNIEFERMESPKSLLNLREEQKTASSQSTSLSSPSSPHPDTISPSINILKAVLTGSQEVSNKNFIFYLYLEIFKALIIFFFLIRVCRNIDSSIERDEGNVMKTASVLFRS